MKTLLKGNPPDREYANKMWDWIDKTLSESESFDFLFVAGHYQVLDSRGEYDKALVHNLLPMLRKYNVQGYFQGHRHTMEHNQGKRSETTTLY